MGASVALQSPFLTRFLEIKITTLHLLMPWRQKVHGARGYALARVAK